MSVFPFADVLIYGDMFDPESHGTYLGTAPTVSLLKDKMVNVSGASVSMKDILIFAPWQYQNTYSQDSELSVNDAKITTEAKHPVKALTAGYIACSTIPSWLFRRLCQAAVTKWTVVDYVLKSLESEIDVSFDSKGSYYNSKNTLDFFIGNGFRVITVSAFAKDEIYSSNLSMFFKSVKAVKSLSKSDREKYIPGYYAASWGARSDASKFDASKSMYDQGIRYNIIEAVASAYGDAGDYENSGLLYGDMVFDSLNDLYIDKEQVSELDYFVHSWDEFGYIQNVSSNNPKADYVDAILFCNELSKERGLDTVYSYDGLLSSSLKISGINELEVDLTKNGYRFPTENEIRNAKNSNTISSPSNNLEYISHIGSPLPTVVISKIGSDLHTNNVPCYNNTGDSVETVINWYITDSDEISFRIVKNKPNNIYFSNQNFTGSKTLAAINLVELSDVTMESSSSLTVISKNEIRIVPDFHCPVGARLHLKIN